jgi:hypothetical protein
MLKILIVNENYKRRNNFSKIVKNTVIEMELRDECGIIRREGTQG